MDLIIDPGLMLYIPFYETDGASLVSRDNKGHLCAVIGSLWTPQGREYEGEGDYITIPRHPYIEPAEFTLEAWVRPAAFDTSYSVIFSKDQVSHVMPYYSYHLRTNNTGILHFEWNDGTINRNLNGGSISIGVWTHLAATFKGGEQIIYKDGAKVLADSRYDSISYFDTDLIIGTSLNLENSDFIGTIGEVRIYNRALTALEIQRNMRATKWRYR